MAQITPIYLMARCQKKICGSLVRKFESMANLSPIRTRTSQECQDPTQNFGLTTPRARPAQGLRSSYFRCSQFLLEMTQTLLHGQFIPQKKGHRRCSKAILLATETSTYHEPTKPRRPVQLSSCVLSLPTRCFSGRLIFLDSVGLSHK